MTHQFIFGLIGPVCTAQARRLWNQLLKERQIDGFFDFYRTTNEHALVTRLAEMFLLERRGYLIHESLQKAAFSLMDRLAPSAVKCGLVDTVTNERGVLVGHFLAARDLQTILDAWMEGSTDSRRDTQAH